MIDEKDRELFRLTQSAFPITLQPYQALGKMAGITEKETIARLKKLKRLGLIRRIGPVWDAKSLGLKSLLVAFKVGKKNIVRAAGIINRCKGVTHNYLREAEYNLWFTLTAIDEAAMEKQLNRIIKDVKPDKTLKLPALKIYKIGVKLEA